MARRSCCFALAAALAACAPSTSPQPLRFPKGFLFGASIAGFQVDMGCPTLPEAQCEDQNSDWYQWITDPRILADPAAVNFAGGPPKTGPGFYELYPQDLARAKNELHLGAIRLSIEWSRIFPTSTVGITGYDNLKKVASPAGVAFYHNIFAAMKKLGLKPLVTVNHYTLPLWIHDGADCHFNYASDPEACPWKGWLDPNTITEIAKYAGFVAKEYGGEVDLWATENEPLALPLSGYLEPTLERTNPPGLAFKGKEAREVAINLIEAHARMYDAIKENDTVDADGDGVAAQVGLVLSMAAVQSAGGKPEDDTAAQNMFYLYDQLYLDATIKGDLDATLSGVTAQTHRADLAGRMDYVGINYYTEITVAGLDGSLLADFSPLLTLDPASPQTNLSVYDPRGLYDMAMFVTRRYHLPIIITENSVQETPHPMPQAQGLVEYLQWLHKAIADGADVRGYFWWTLMDNYEWNHGMAPEDEFGLYKVDPNDPKKTRTIRVVGQDYARIAASGAIPTDLLSKYPVK